ncbi:hypothetical protein E2R58_15085 [Paenibacillus amylolyticus]|uniref:hypothetical protein n=1 Tax=Paenibacillus amylolyticus TaxID=1451 RepID=UPI00105A181E|nr:hypothetical protein [Paenibacillus amylolyticus]TDL70404.1 hypothetical protein E2R58_15085 [Paenibacillus amylolyticus]
MVDDKLLTELSGEFERLIPNFLTDFNVLRLDESKFVFEHGETKVTVAVDYSKIISGHNMYSSIGRVLTSFKKEIIERENRSFTIYRDCGFHDKKQNYSEFLITYDSLFYFDPTFIEHYLIGEVNVEVSEPSSLYRLIFNSFTDDKGFGDEWINYKTVKLKDCTLADQERVLQQVLFLIAIYHAPEFEFIDDYPAIVPYTIHGDDAKWNDPEEKLGNSVFDKYLYTPVKYLEPIALYNKAKKLDDPILYYRILEYFFIINKKNEIKKSIEKYNNVDDIDVFIVEMSALYRKDEPELLKNLLPNIEGIEHITDFAKQKELVDSLDVPTFATKLYEYRNSIVHSKYDTKFKINVPTIEIFHPESKDRYWIEILRKLAEKIIVHFC